MKKTTTIFFDLDGTVYPLYQQPAWLDRITTLADPSVYAVEDTLVSAVKLNETLIALVHAGYSIGVISWLAGGASPEYAKASRTAKREYVKKFLPMVTEMHIVAFGTPKHRTIRNNPAAILVDDNAEVRTAWTHGETIDPTKNLLESLQNLL